MLPRILKTSYHLNHFPQNVDFSIMKQVTLYQVEKAKGEEGFKLAAKFILINLLIRFKKKCFRTWFMLCEKFDLA